MPVPLHATRDTKTIAHSWHRPKRMARARARLARSGYPAASTGEFDRLEPTMHLKLGEDPLPIPFDSTRREPQRGGEVRCRHALRTHAHQLELSAGELAGRASPLRRRAAICRLHSGAQALQHGGHFSSLASDAEGVTIDFDGNIYVVAETGPTLLVLSAPQPVPLPPSMALAASGLALLLTVNLFSLRASPGA